MTQHITVFGKPWCECGGDRRLFNLPPEADDLQPTALPSGNRARS